MKVVRKIAPTVLGVMLVIVTAGSAADAQKKAKKPKAVKPAYITSPPVRVKSHVRNGKVVKAHDRLRKVKTNP